MALKQPVSFDDPGRGACRSGGGHGPAREYRTITDPLSPRAVLIGDNAPVTDKLAAFAEATDRRFVFFREQPLDHFYLGAGIGIAFR
ncbi:MAG: hypothetical protein EPO08_18590 [Rhodospirillaceae bacterium]|nr:MAG: hypothetical protein EPO08_18590 [Rhodospirillaceae bacterium]